jgi:RNA polymerase-interacting CarD/CdnL/TRCF family regulator
VRVVEQMRRPEEAGNWSRRYKLNLEKLVSEDPALVSEVIVDLELQDREVGLSAGERRMLDRAWTMRQLLSSELPPLRRTNDHCAINVPLAGANNGQQRSPAGTRTRRSKPMTGCAVHLPSWS